MVPLLMSLLQYFERADVLPDPRGTLSTSLPPRAIARANAEVRRSLDEGNSMKYGTLVQFLHFSTRNFRTRKFSDVKKFRKG